MAERPACVCSQVFENTRPVLLLVTEDGDLQFMCGQLHAPGDLPHVVGLDHLLERDPSLAEILQLPSGWEAERSSPEQPWVRRRLGQKSQS